MISRDEFDRLQEEFTEYATELREKDRHRRGGTTLGEMLDDDSFGEAWEAMLRSPEYIRRQVYRNLEYLMGDPDEDGDYSGSLYNMYSVGINRVDHVGGSNNLVEIGTLAARHYKEKKAQNRISSLRDFADLCRALANTFERRIEEESTIRRIQ